MASPRPIKTAVCGVGLAGLTFHVPFVLALPELFSLVAVLERSPKGPGGKVHERFGVSVLIYRTLEELLADKEIELVIVGTPNPTHYDFAKAALLAGKHVLVDKPVTPTSVQARELGDIARSKNLVIYAYQNRRWDSDYLTLHKLLSLPESSPQSLGSIVEFESRFDRFRPALKETWKDEALPAAGQTFDLGAHLIDQALATFGRPHRITAFISNQRGIGSPAVDDNFTIYLHYGRSSGSPFSGSYPLTCILRSSVLSVRSKQIRYVVRGTKGTYEKYGLDVQEDQMKAAQSFQAILADDFGKEDESMQGTGEWLRDGKMVTERVPTTEKGTYISLFKDLASAIRHGSTPVIQWDQATSVIEMIELAHTSSREGRTLDVSQTQTQIV